MGQLMQNGEDWMAAVMERVRKDTDFAVVEERQR